MHYVIIQAALQELHGIGWPLNTPNFSPNHKVLVFQFLSACFLFCKMYCLRYMILTLQQIFYTITFKDILNQPQCKIGQSEEMISCVTVPPKGVDQLLHVNQLWRVDKKRKNYFFCSFSDVFSWFQKWNHWKRFHQVTNNCKSKDRSVILIETWFNGKGFPHRQG